MSLQARDTLRDLPVGWYNVASYSIIDEGLFDNGDYHTIFELTLKDKNNNLFKAYYTSEDKDSCPEAVSIADFNKKVVLYCCFAYNYVINQSYDKFLPLTKEDIIPIHFHHFESLTTWFDNSGHKYSVSAYRGYRTYEAAKKAAEKHNKVCLEAASTILREVLDAMDGFNKK